jgi:hypothetical protein
MKPGWNPTKRNRKIGTADQGFSQNNKLVIPQKWSDLKVFWERLTNPVVNTITIEDHSVTVLVEQTKKGYIHSCTIDDVKTILKYIPKRDIEEISLIVFRQPKRKEEIINRAWGRYVYYADIGKYSGPGIYLEAQPINCKIKWPLSATPDQLKEIQRLEEDGHIITRDKRHFYIQTSPDTIRNTQLYRTFPHEVGHAVDYLINSLEPSINAETENESDYISKVFDSKPPRDKEAFAHRYADKFKKDLFDKKIIPFDRIINEGEMIKMNLNPEWFPNKNLTTNKTNALGQ